MKRALLIVASFSVMALVAAFAWQRPEPNTPQAWASRAMAETPTVAVLVEFGVKDKEARDWSGQATVDGAKVVNREGYRFRKGDKLVNPNAWEASSRRAIRAPKGMPQITKLEPIASVGIVFHLQDLKDDAGLTVTLKEGERDKARVPFRDILQGQPVKLW